MSWNYLKLIIFKSIYVKIQIYCIFIRKVESKIFKINPPQKMDMLICTFNETGVRTPVSLKV